MVGDVGEDGVEGGAIQPSAAQLLAHQIDARRRDRQRRADRRALRQSEVAKSVLGEPDLVLRDERVETEAQHSGDLARLAGMRIRADDARAIHRIETEIALGHRAAMDHDDPLAQRFDAQMLESEHPVFH